METRANYVLIGAFTLAVLVAAFGFVFWFQNMGTAKTRIAYRIVFEGPVSGLRTGANVNFNGIRIGEVASVKIDDPHNVVAMVKVERKAPVRKDTQITLEFQGLTGIAAVSMKGGAVDAPEVEPDDEGILTLYADLSAGQDFTESARVVLSNVNRLISENQQSIKNAVKNVETFSAALSENSKRLDSIMAGLELMVNKDGKGEFQAAIGSFKDLSENLDKRTADITAGVNKFTANGTREISVLISDARKTLADISRAFTNLDKNPSRLLFGGAPPDDTRAQQQRR
ncbi:ABC transporter [Afipia sp. P52-10]|jgi:phospholipid/cholesterol/gamma-HCH transport system substrate-binding protein|uniref:MlaD family protein n=1 Tax=Afipia sp. P52-10 TaxID=1429916 RepID=UPI0003DF3211|nr:MlaD family protein [Afipia sp. P52-10]ETR76490.1 ABC transporter [Afipia sp. P52-10]